MNTFATLLCFLAPLVARPLSAPQRGPQAPDASTIPLRFGVYQSEKATIMYKKLTPVLEALQEDAEKRIGQPLDIELKIFKTYDEAIDALVQGEIDFVRFGPAPYVIAKKRQPGVRLLAMEQENGEKRFKGVVAVRKNSPIRTLADLKGKRFAFGDRNSTIGRYLIQAELAKAGIKADDLEKYDFLPRHDAVASAVEMGDFDAGSLRIGAFEKSNEKGALRILWTFENVTSPWAARAGLDPKVADALSQALFALSDPLVLRELKISGFLPTSDDEYQFVREGMKHADEFESSTPRQ